MKKYFYSNGKKQFGPLTFEEVGQKDISDETLIWFEGLEDWKKARDIDHLQPILEQKPPLLITEEQNTLIEQKVNKSKNEKRYESTDGKKRLFQNILSFNGRIRRLEYGLTLAVVGPAYFLVNYIFSQEVELIYYRIVIVWFLVYVLFAQGAKRAHDMNLSGWMTLVQIFPPMSLMLLFGNPSKKKNKYGETPK